MTTDQLKAALERRPFVPFVIRQADGRETRITHPEAAAYGGGRIATYIHPDGRVVFVHAQGRVQREERLQDAAPCLFFGTFRHRMARIDPSVPYRAMNTFPGESPSWRSEVKGGS